MFISQPRKCDADGIRLVPCVRLQMPFTDVLVFPADTVQPQFTPFRLPRFHVSQIHWLLNLGSKFWLRHQRCLVVLIGLDVRDQAWECLIRRSHAMAKTSLGPPG